MRRESEHRWGTVAPVHDGATSFGAFRALAGLAVIMATPGVSHALGSPATPVGDEIRINSTYEGNQYSPAIASNAIGHSIVVWANRTDDHSPGAIIGQRLNGAGLAWGEEFRISGKAAWYAEAPDVASDDDGNFAVVWQDDNMEAGPGPHVYMRLFDRYGIALAAEFRVDGTTREMAFLPQVARTGAGRIIVVWHTWNGSTSEIRGRRFTASGAPLGEEFTVVADATNALRGARVGIDNSGRITVGWSQNTAATPTEPASYDVYRRRCASDGTTWSASARVNRSTTLREQRFDMAVDATGNAVFAWLSEPAFGANRLRGQRISTTGGLAGAEFEIVTGVNPLDVTVSKARSTGHFTVGWTQFNGAYHLFYRHYATDGTALTSPTPATGKYHTLLPSIASDADGDFTLAWQSDDLSTWNSEINGRRYSGSEMVDASVRVAGSPNSVPRGAHVEHVVRVTNHHAPSSLTGVGYASGMTLVAKPSTGTQVVYAEGDNWNCTIDGDARCLYVGFIPPEYTANNLFVVTRPMAAGASSLSVQISGNQYDANPANDSAVETTTVDE
ncbi:hypothetical protein [Tahibacter amnicola]|uniref:Uncharacterized protein n=1 Tax=Tahibacter amnicola TaxID=2976241 RepID=A0ABY6BBX8_9GAMM|nr:hypothetical protein [Tahibacter amnicola]UXI65815.1 hypothetical protein N4264_13690 [Tahibacter amnicola]